MSHRTALSMSATLVSVTFLASAQTTGFVPFDQFLAHTRAQTFNPIRNEKIRVNNARNFDEMRGHILSMYEGVRVNRSFLQGTSHFDCVPIDQQYSVRALGLKSLEIAPPVNLLAAHESVEDATAGLSSKLVSPAVNDGGETGGPASCEENTVPMRRIEMEELLRYPTLEDFFRKKPAAVAPETESAKEEVAPAVNASHKYSYFTQTVDNIGANSALNIWSPYVNTAAGQVFSLSQQWYVGGSGAGLQTAEVGWQNYPGKYGDQRSRLFIYFTADNYTKTGCYNTDCGTFVQTSNTMPLGGAFPNYSVAGGAQYDFNAQFLLFNGNWWLAINGSWVGYYPASIYNGGQMTKFAQRIEFGTETVGGSTWPAAGSGAWSTQAFGYAAYHRNLYYMKTTGGSVWDSLSPVTPSASCYNTSGTYYSTSSGWGTYFYAGGPGGSGC